VCAPYHFVQNVLDFITVLAANIADRDAVRNLSI